VALVHRGIFITYFLLIVVLPFSVLLWSSFQKFYAVPSWQALNNLTLDPYRFILSYPNITRSIWNSFFLSLSTAITIMLVTSVICWIVVKTKLRGRWILDNVASLPMVFPGLVLGLSIMIFYLNVDIGVYGTMWIMFIAYVTRFMPYGLRYNTTVDAPDPQGARGVVADERGVVVHDVPADHPAAPEAGPRGGLHLRDDRLDPRALELDPALQPRHRGRLDRDLGAVGERPVRRAFGARACSSSSRSSSW
jgi:hypothetical protein